MEEDIKILEEYLKPRLNAKTHLGYEVVRYPELEAIENLIKGYRELDKDNNDLRRLYRRTVVKLKENGHEEVADYFLAQINEVPTFVVEDDIDYYAEYYKMKTKIRELEKCLEVTSKSLNNVAYDQIPLAIQDLIVSSIPKSKIKEKIKEIEQLIEYEKQYGNVANREKLEFKKEIYMELMEE